MKTFNEYLQAEGYATATIRTREEECIFFTKWCKKRKTTPMMVDYKTCLKYIESQKRKGNTVNTINFKLAHLRVYFEYLIEQGCRIDNPIENTFIKGGKKIYHTLLEPDELEDLYYSFETDTFSIKNVYNELVAKRDKMVIGLLVYQGLDTKNLKALKLEHLQLQKGTIYIPGDRRSNGRRLELKPWQIMELMEYINTIRPAMIKRIKNLLNYEQLIPYGEQFIFMNALIKKLKKHNHKVSNIKQIRASVITNWLKQYDLRKTQVLAGHKNICSTERYLQDDLENLQEIITNFHPIS